MARGLIKIWAYTDCIYLVRGKKGKHMIESVEEWRRIFERQHDQIGSRANMFIVINALLMAAVTSSNNCGLQIMVRIIGFVSCLLWLSLSNYSKNRYDFFHKKLLEYEKEINENDRIYTIIKNEAPKGEHQRGQAPTLDRLQVMKTQLPLIPQPSPAAISTPNGGIKNSGAKPWKAIQKSSSPT
jgi:hypothetical protein